MTKLLTTSTEFFNIVYAEEGYEHLRENQDIYEWVLRQISVQIGNTVTKLSDDFVSVLWWKEKYLTPDVHFVIGNDHLSQDIVSELMKSGYIMMSLPNVSMPKFPERNNAIIAVGTSPEDFFDVFVCEKPSVQSRAQWRSLETGMYFSNIELAAKVMEENTKWKTLTEGLTFD